MSDGRDSPAEAARQFLLSRINYERSAVMPYSERAFRLDRMRYLLRQLGDPQDRLPIIHIAGTKGKGSTAAMTAAILSAAGYRTGLYHSPHLDCVEERLIVAGEACPADEFARLVAQIRPVAEAMDRLTAEPGERTSPATMSPTFFELTTALAFLYFAQRAVDVVVLEVGLGGRLDSTNVCLPRVAVITNISFDHTQQLGNTLAKIAREKAGIIKPGVPVVNGVLDDEPRQVIEQVAAAAASPLRQLGTDFDFVYRPPLADGQRRGRVNVRLRGPDRRLEGLSLGLLGRHQAANAALAIAALAELERQGWTIPEEAIRRGVADVRWPARIEVVHERPTVVLDAAHNLASIQALLATLDESFAARRRVLVFGASSDKDVRGMVAVVAPRFDQVVFTRYVHNPRAVPPQELVRLAPDLAAAPLVCDTPAAAWDTARRTISPDDVLCITGSFFLAAEMRAQMHSRPLLEGMLAASGDPAS
jgi:dihydrofolate synthase / folylpolyglutamate synthase